jgi:hypothetical protein
VRVIQRTLGRTVTGETSGYELLVGHVACWIAYAVGWVRALHPVDTVSRGMVGFEHGVNRHP